MNALMNLHTVTRRSNAEKPSNLQLMGRFGRAAEQAGQATNSPGHRQISSAASMKVLVTGSAGFIAQALMRRLTAAEYRVSGLDKDPSATSHYVCSILDAATLK